MRVYRNRKCFHFFVVVTKLFVFLGDDDGGSEHDEDEDSDDNEDGEGAGADGGAEVEERSEKNPPDGKVLVKLRHVYGQDPGLFEEFSRFVFVYFCVTLFDRGGGDAYVELQNNFGGGYFRPRCFVTLGFRGPFGR